MGMVETDDVLAALAAFALDADQFFGIDVVAVLRRVGARVASAGDRCDDAGAVVGHSSEQHSAAFVGIGFFAVLAEGGVVGLGDAEHQTPNSQHAELGRARLPVVPTCAPPFYRLSP